MANNDGDDAAPLRWKNQSKHLQTALKRMYEDLVSDQNLTDVSLVSLEGEVIEAHKGILSISSPYFQRLFSNVQLKSKCCHGPTVVVLGNVKMTHLKNLLEFIYTGEVNASSCDKKQLVKIGNFLEIPGLAGSCGNEGTDRQTEERNNSRKSDGGDEFQDDYFDVFRTNVSEDEDEDCLPESEVKFNRSLRDRSVQESNDDSFHCNDSSNKVTMETDGDEHSDSFSTRSSTSAPRKRKRRVKSKIEWRKIPSLTPEELARDWRIYSTHTSQNSRNGDVKQTIIHYCVYGYLKCKMRLKKETFNGKTEFFSNGLPHENHKSYNGLGLGDSNKAFIIGLVKRGITKPRLIIEEFEKKNLAVPKMTQVTSFLQKYKEKEKRNEKGGRKTLRVLTYTKSGDSDEELGDSDWRP